MTIRFDAVSFRYPGADTPALRDVSLEFAPGSVTLVTGRLGAGASTLLLAAAGLAPHVTGGDREGTVTTLGVDPATPEGRRALAGRVGLLLPTPWTQLSGMAYTVWEEVAFGPANLGWPRERIADAVDKALDAVGAEQLAGRDPRTLSGGELQRVMYAGVLAMEPEVLLLDEPAIELDPSGARTLYASLSLVAERATVVLATTDLDRAVEHADRAVLLQEGAVVEDGAPDEVLGSRVAVERGVAPRIAALAGAAGAAEPYPITVQAAVTRWRGR
jgi:energy-coupling factor transport system ATP-binding protein